LEQEEWMSAPFTVAAAPTLAELHKLVHQTLCKRDRLEAEQTPLLRGLIKRGGKPCGLFFQIEGPRLMKNYAVWAGDEDRILFYDSAGERYAEIHLSEAPDPQTAVGLRLSTVSADSR
jgi:hypothetical protein